MPRPKKTPIQHDPVVTRFGQRLRALRTERGMSQAELARQAQVTVNYVSKLEKLKVRSNEEGLIGKGRETAVQVGRQLQEKQDALLDSAQGFDRYLGAVVLLLHIQVDPFECSQQQ